MPAGNTSSYAVFSVMPEDECICEGKKKQLEHTKHGVGILNAIDCEMTMDLIVMDCRMRGWARRALGVGQTFLQLTFNQNWEFAHLISEQMARFLSKNEGMSDLLKKISNSLIRSFFVSKMSNSLMIAHFLWAT